eukprot:9487374-Alexandrium_andersonii.AAC.1
MESSRGRALLGEGSAIARWRGAPWGLNRLRSAGTPCRWPDTSPWPLCARLEAWEAPLPPTTILYLPRRSSTIG